MPTLDELEHFHPRTRAEWRMWLEQNYATSPGVWLIYNKKDSGQPRVSYEEAVEEALCFGWIDALARAIDDLTYRQHFSPRKPKSPWSKPNKKRVEKLIEQGLMTPAGMKMIELAQSSGTWNTLDTIDTLTIPDDLITALAVNETAQSNFEAFPPSAKKNILWWVVSAKRPETRQKRIAEVVVAAAENKRADPFKPKKK